MSDDVLVLGGSGLAGRAICRMLAADGWRVTSASRKDVDLRDCAAARAFLRRVSPTCVVIAAAKVGGIGAHVGDPLTYTAENLWITTNAITAAAETSSIRRLVFLGSSCIYPVSDQPLRPEMLLSGPLEPTNRGYALAKLAGIELCRAVQKAGRIQCICPMPTNLYGPGDNYTDTGHVFAMLVRKFVEAADQGVEEVTLWGTGCPRREFLHADDLGRAVAVLLSCAAPPFLVNVGSGREVTIHALATLIAGAAGYKGRVRWDHSKPDGVPRKLLDSGVLRLLGWTPEIDLDEGIRRAVVEYRSIEQS